MNWTKSKPAKIGFYWALNMLTHSSTIVFVFWKDGEFWADNPFPACSFKAPMSDHIWDHYKWAGPILDTFAD
jgi:hypothetical protein